MRPSQLASAGHARWSAVEGCGPRQGSSVTGTYGASGSRAEVIGSGGISESAQTDFPGQRIREYLFSQAMMARAGGGRKAGPINGEPNGRVRRASPARRPRWQDAQVMRPRAARPVLIARNSSRTSDTVAWVPVQICIYLCGIQPPRSRRPRSGLLAQDFGRPRSDSGDEAKHAGSI